MVNRRRGELRALNRTVRAARADGRVGDDDGAFVHALQSCARALDELDVDSPRYVAVMRTYLDGLDRLASLGSDDSAGDAVARIVAVPPAVGDAAAS
jgi:hypothetical protein